MWLLDILNNVGTGVAGLVAKMDNDGAVANVGSYALLESNVIVGVSLGVGA